MRHVFKYAPDYMGHPRPKFDIEDASIPPEINLMFPMFYNVMNKCIYYFSNYTISFYQIRRSFIVKTELYRFVFNISSMAIDVYMKLSFILDSSSNLFVLCLRTNFVKLLARNVTDFEYSQNNL
ncbi:hypothetical protein RF11_04399 [Thelohanellus kitauei]|uniref:Uncharacterized protein n=1 Tax=Thelohanellus kitauei TaxID=669202 RepID=A0A0C2IVI7_THEKT|nr:hypothetical protein RF11_04399 [Thelohanellus kitauei]